MVTVFDYNAPSDPNWNPEADLDGDGVVHLFDYNILSASFDLAGD